jgi:hypothetical protein
MNAATETKPSIVDTFSALTEGVRVRVTFRNDRGEQVREVNVTGQEMISDSRYMWTSSGRVRPGHVSGGALVMRDGEVRFSPTLQQKRGLVVALEIVGTVN